MMNQWADIGGKGAQGVEIDGVIPGMTYFPLSHDVGKSCVKTEAQKREKLQGHTLENLHEENSTL